MAARNQTAMIVGVGAVAAGAAALVLHSKSAKAKSSDATDLPQIGPKVGPKTDPKIPPKVDPKVTPKVHPTIGRPFVVGQLAHNLKVAVDNRKLQRHPRGVERPAGASDPQWLATIVVYETWPKVATLPGAWPAAVRDQLPAITRALTERLAKVKDAQDPSQDTDPKDPGAHATFGRPYKPGAAYLAHNVKVAAHAQPTTHPAGRVQGSQPQGAWLGEVVYLETWSKAPVQPLAKHKAHRTWVAAKARAVAAMQAYLKTLPPKLGHRTIGAPFKPGRAQERHNAEAAVRLNPRQHPAKGLLKAGQSDLVRLANIAYAETNPTGPIPIRRPNDKWAKSWKRLHAYVRMALKAKTKDPGQNKVDPTTPPGTTPSKKDTKGLDPTWKLHKTIGGDFRRGEAQIGHNAAVAVRQHPPFHPRGQWQKDKKLSDQIWLSRIVWWESFPEYGLFPKGDRQKQIWRRKVGPAVRTALRQHKQTPPDVHRPTPGYPPGDLAGNVERFCRARPNYHPIRGISQGNRPLSSWGANFIQWSNWPESPTANDPNKLSRADFRMWSKRWLKARQAIEACLKGKAESRAGLRSGPAPKAQSSHTAPPKAAGKMNKRELGVGLEAHNAAVAFLTRPKEARGRRFRDANKRQKQLDWLTNVALWSTYPTAPLALDPKDKTHQVYIAAWKRMHGHLQRQAKVARTWPQNPIDGVSDAAWRTWVLAVTVATPVRSATKIADATRKALRYLATKEGRMLVERDVGQKVAGRSVSRSGLLAEALRRIPNGQLSGLTHWRKQPSRAFVATTGLF